MVSPKLNLQDLLQHDSSLKIMRDDQLAISKPCSFDEITENGLIFIKNKIFFKKLFELYTPQLGESKKKIKVLIEEKFFSHLSSEDKSFLDQFSSLAVSPSVATSLALISKPFFDLKIGSLNTQVDGRQMGTVDIDPSAHIAQNVFIGEFVRIGKNVEILPGSVIHSHSVVEENTRIFSNVTLYPFTKVGKDCRIHSGVVLGSDGYGYSFFQGMHLKIWHMGGVVIHDDVEIGANTCVDMGTFSPTIIGSGTRLDNLVQVAHNVKMGKGCLICGQAGIAGSAILGNYVVMGGRAAVGPDAFIGDGSQIAGGAKVNEGAIWPAGSKLGGHPARNLHEWMRGIAFVRSASLKNAKTKEL